MQVNRLKFWTRNRELPDVPSAKVELTEEQKVDIMGDALITPPELVIPEPQESEAELIIRDRLKFHIDAGMSLQFEDDSWFIAKGDKEDSGRMDMPIRDIMRCANVVCTPRPETKKNKYNPYSE